jgi:V-type H+-transporting ATPase subunit H
MSTEPSIDPSPYLKSLQNNIRARPIPWEGAVRAGSITDEQWKRIKAVDKVRTEQRQSAVENDLKNYAALLVGGSGGSSILESAAKRTDIIQYILVLARDLVKGRA